MMNCDRHELARKVDELKAAPVGSKNGGQLFAFLQLFRYNRLTDRLRQRLVLRAACALQGWLPCCIGYNHFLDPGGIQIVPID